MRRSCQSALARSTYHDNGSVRSRRAFSCNRSNRRGTLPQFLEPSSPELTTLLSQINSKILLPEHLTKEQRKLVFKPENKARLDAEPIEITLGEVTLPLEYIDVNRDQPSKWRTIKDLVNKSSTPTDFENVVRMMEGFENASIRLRPQWQEKIVKKLHQAEMHHLILKTLQRAGSTGLRLRDVGIVQQVFKSFREKAANSDWEEVSTKKALSFAEQAIELMENKEHLGRAAVGPQDLRASPLVIAVPLELAAARAKAHTGGQDTDGKVKKFASRLMNALHQDDFKTVVLPKLLKEISEASVTFDRPHQKVRALADLKRRMFAILPLWNALRTGHQVLGTEMPMAKDAQQVKKETEVALKKGEETLQESVRNGFDTYVGDISGAIKTCEKL